MSTDKKQTKLFELKDYGKKIPTCVPREKKDDRHQRDLQGLPFYWKLAWPYYDTVFEPCGYRRQITVHHLEDPDFEFVLICPWGRTEHQHDIIPPQA